MLGQIGLVTNLCHEAKIFLKISNKKTMALFSKNKTRQDKSERVETTTSKASASAAKSGVKTTKKLNSVARPVLKGMRITEKAVLANDKNVYVFDVDTRATSHEVKQAVQKFYKVNPLAIRMVNLPGKVKRRGDKLGRTNRTRKAYVTLPANQSIELA